MGMYDTIFINKEKLPITEEEKKCIHTNHSWQTKDFDCTCTEIYITDEGELKINRFDWAEVPKEERPYPDRNDFLGLAGSMKRVNEHLETIAFHGIIYFYGTVGTDWYDFYAIFTHGKLEEVKGGKERFASACFVK